jgi:hypothetical protein
VTVTCRRAQAVNPTIVMSLGNTFGYTAIRQAVDLQACRPKRATFWSGRGCVAWRPKPRWTSAFTHHFLPRCDLLIIDKARYSTPPRSLIMPLTWVNIDLVRSEGLEPPAFWSVGPPRGMHHRPYLSIPAGQPLSGEHGRPYMTVVVGPIGNTFGKTETSAGRDLITLSHPRSTVDAYLLARRIRRSLRTMASLG